MKNLFVIALVFTASNFTGNAQSIRFGVTAGATFANYSAKVDVESENGNFPPLFVFPYFN